MESLRKIKDKDSLLKIEIEGKSLILLS